jgi:NAD(P)-dependent dehydrogenase (short-subunit alcohol dehydrogenase family)
MANILITGSARGIGYELVKKYAQDGDTVYATTRSPEKADALNALAAEYAGVHVMKMDVGDSASVAACAAEIGEVPLDVVINNAGVWGGLETQTFDNMDYDNWAFEFNVMAMGPWRVMQTFFDNVMASDQKKIITVTSQVGAHAYDHLVGYSYASAKAAVNRLVTALSQEKAGTGVCIALMHPGWVKTDMAGDVADITPEESALGVHMVIAGMTEADSGKFMKWDGGIHPW